MRTRPALGATAFVLVVACGVVASLHPAAARPGSSAVGAAAGTAPSGSAGAVAAAASAAAGFAEAESSGVLCRRHVSWGPVLPASSVYFLGVATGGGPRVPPDAGPDEVAAITRALATARFVLHTDGRMTFDDRRGPDASPFRLRGERTPSSRPPADSLWHESHLLRDLTGSGRPDSLALTAVGAGIDHLAITFEVWSGGERIYSDSWPSALYYRYTYPPREGRIELAERRWSEFFADSAFRAASAIESDPPRGMEPGGPRHYIAFRLAYEATLDSLLAAGVDPALARGQARQAGWAMPDDDPRIVGIWNDIRTTDPTTFTYFRGGEDTRAIAWSPEEGRFFIVYSCC